jgi:serine/threonine protein kinase
MASIDRLTSSPAPHGRPVGPYLMYGPIAAGGLTSVHFGRQRGPGGVCRTVAIRRLPPRLAGDLHFLSRLVADARLLAGLRHPHLVPLLDAVVLDSDEVMLVTEYVHGETVASLLGGVWERGEMVPPAVAVAVVSEALEGLGAAHRATDEDGNFLSLVHGDVSPATFLVGADGRTRVLEFGVAEVTAAGTDGPAGTPAYLAPEKLQRRPSGARADVYAAGVVLWEMLTMRRLYAGPDEESVEARARGILQPSALNPEVPADLDVAVLAALRADPRERWTAAQDFAAALKRACPAASSREVSAWVRGVRGVQLDQRARELGRIERVSMGELLARSMGDDDDDGARATSLLVVSSERGSGSSHEWVSPSEIDLVEDQPTAVRAAGAAPLVEEAPARLEAPPFAPEVSVRDYQVVELVERTSELGPRLQAVDVRAPPPAPAPGQRASWLVDTAMVLVLGIFATAFAVGARRARPEVVVAAPPPPQPPPSEPALFRAAAPVPAPAPAVVLIPRPRPGRPVVHSAVERMTEIASLNRRALQSYQRGELAETLRLLTRSMAVASENGLERHELSALSHLHMGVLLAGGLHQRELAIKHFRLALAIRPDIRPSPPVATPEVLAAFRDAVAGGD